MQIYIPKVVGAKSRNFCSRLCLWVPVADKHLRYFAPNQSRDSGSPDEDFRRPNM